MTFLFTLLSNTNILKKKKKSLFKGVNEVNQINKKYLLRTFYVARIMFLNPITKLFNFIKNVNK